MPLITVEGPSLDVEKKRFLVKKLTEVAVETYEIEHIIVIIHENKTENVATNGQLILDKQKDK